MNKIIKALGNVLVTVISFCLAFGITFWFFSELRFDNPLYQSLCYQSLIVGLLVAIIINVGLGKDE